LLPGRPLNADRRGDAQDQHRELTIESFARKNRCASRGLIDTVGTTVISICDFTADARARASFAIAEFVRAL
jgi:hypothetical protein